VGCLVKGPGGVVRILWGALFCSCLILSAAARPLAPMCLARLGPCAVLRQPPRPLCLRDI